MARLHIKSGAAQVQTIDLKPGVNRLGRSQDNDFPLDDLTVSDQHCEIVFINDSVLVRDLRSTNGTWVNGRRIIESELHAGQALKLGGVEMVLDAVPPVVAIPALPVPRLQSSTRLADGYPSCIHHSMRHATLHCPHCGKLYCNTCVHVVKRVGGKSVVCCPVCSTQCVQSEWAVELKRKKNSFLGRIWSKLQKQLKRFR